MNSSLVEMMRSVALGMALTLVWIGCAAVVGAVKSKSSNKSVAQDKIEVPAVVMGEPQLVYVDADIRIPPKSSERLSAALVVGPLAPCRATREQTTVLIDEASLLVEEIHEMQVQMEVLTNEVE